MKNVGEANGLRSIHNASANCYRKRTLPTTKEKKVFTQMQFLSRNRVNEGNEICRRVSAKRLAVILKILLHQKQKQNRQLKK